MTRVFFFLTARLSLGCHVLIISSAGIYVRCDIPEGYFIGFVKSWNDTKGFGFISPAADENGLVPPDVFIHRLDICSTSQVPSSYTTRTNRPASLRVLKRWGADFAKPSLKHNTRTITNLLSMMCAGQGNGQLDRGMTVLYKTKEMPNGQTRAW